MQPTAIDHLLFAFLVLGVPLWARWGYRRLLRKLGAGALDPRVSEYRSTLRVQWGFTALLLFWWLLSDRSWSLLGFGHDSIAPVWIGYGLTIAAVGFLTWQTLSVSASEERLRELEGQLEGLRGLLPHDEREGRWFRAVAVTAGICEEIAYRGFLIAYLRPGLGPWGALVVSSLAFGMGHLYQGPLGMVKTALVGALMGLLYLLTGSLWAPMLVHALVDLSSGELARRVLSLPRNHPFPASGAGNPES